MRESQVQAHPQVFPSPHDDVSDPLWTSKHLTAAATVTGARHVYHVTIPHALYGEGATPIDTTLRLPGSACSLHLEAGRVSQLGSLPERLALTSVGGDPLPVPGDLSSFTWSAQSPCAVYQGAMRGTAAGASTASQLHTCECASASAKDSIQHGRIAVWVHPYSTGEHR